MPATNLFNQISGLRKKTTRILLAPGERVFNEKSGESYSLPAEDAEPFAFDVHTVTPDEVMVADAVVTAMPKQLFEERPSPTGHGMVKVMVGYDYDDPAYVEDRRKQMPKRNAYIALMGCDDLMESAPGNDIDEKATAICAAFPAFILEFLSLNIERISIYNLVGTKEVEDFLAKGSEGSDTNTSKNSGGRSPQGKKSSPSKSSTARTRNSKSGKPPAGGTA